MNIQYIGKGCHTRGCYNLRDVQGHEYCSKCMWDYNNRCAKPNCTNRKYRYSTYCSYHIDKVCSQLNCYNVTKNGYEVCNEHYKILKCKKSSCTNIVITDYSDYCENHSQYYPSNSYPNNSNSNSNHSCKCINYGCPNFAEQNSYRCYECNEYIRDNCSVQRQVPLGYPLVFTPSYYYYQ